MRGLCVTPDHEVNASGLDLNDDLVSLRVGKGPLFDTEDLGRPNIRC